MTATNRNRRNRLLIGASLAALTVIGAGNAHAQNLGERRPVDPAVAAAQASQNAASRNAQAEAAAQRTRASFEAASRARAQMDAAQNAAREAARLAQTSIPNGLGKGGLQPSADITIDPSLWVGAKGPTQSQGTNGRTNVAVDQTQEKAILTWETFNVGRETDLTFNQQGNKNWIALNRVSDPGANPTQILGSIKADGSVYIINPNGVIFGGTSQVNVRSLIASSLDINAATLEARNQRFLDGLVPGTRYPPATFSDGAAQTDPNEVFERGDGITVMAGARINVASLGQAVLIGHSVINEGSIFAPDGQVVLAAGREVYLEDGLKRVASGSGDPSEKIRGFAVNANGGGQVENSGLIEAERGNIMLTGKSILQNGLLTATTAIDANGSIILNATYGKPNDNRVLIGASMYRGEVIFGSDSYVSILPDKSGKKLPGDSFKASQIEVHGHNILFEDNSTLYAPGAQLHLLSTSPYTSTEPGRLYLGKGAVLDVSGLNGVEIDMAQNEIRASLTANELADNPVLRESALRGETVYFDARLGEKLTDGSGVANLSGWYDLIKRPVEQFMTTGGSITLKGAEIIAREGSTIDLSGGSVHYNSGYVKSTNLIDRYGRIVPIEQAMAGVAYAGVEGDFIVDHARWGVTERFTSAFSRARSGAWHKGYVEGRSAGTLNVQSTSNGVTSEFYQGQAPDHGRIFDGEVRAGVITGDYQTDAPAGASIADVAHIWRERPTLGTLIWSGNVNDFFGGRGESFGGNITIANTGPRIVGEFGSDTALFDYDANAASLVEGIVAHDHVLPTSWFDGETFGTVTLYSGDAVRGSYMTDAQGNLLQREDMPPTGGVLTIGQGVTVNLGDYGAFNFIGRQANIDGTILAPGGSVALEAVWTPKLTGERNATLYETPLNLRPGVRLGETGVINVAGRWSNNWLEALNGETLTSPVVDGGSVRIVAYRIALEEGSLIDVSGGAHLATDGQELTLGDGGSILLDVSQRPDEGELVMGGALHGFAPGKGGTLAIDTPQDLYIGEGWVPDEDGVLHAGEPAEGSFLLVEDLVIPAGTPLPIDVPYTYEIPGYTVAEPGETLQTDISFDEYPIPGSIIDRDWIIPDTISDVQDINGDSIGSSGDILPAGTIVAYIVGYLAAGTQVPGFLFPNGIQVPPRTVDDIHPVGAVLDTNTVYRGGSAVPEGTTFSVDVPKYATSRIRQINTDHFTQGGFANFSLTGARGVTIQSGTIIEPNVDTLMLAGTVRNLATGADLLAAAQTTGTGVTLVNSTDLPESLRQTTNLSLSTFLLDTIVRRSSDASYTYPTLTDRPGSLVLGEGAEIRLTPGSQVVLDSLANLSINGTITTPGGSISLAEQSPSAKINLGENARLLAAGYIETLLTDGYEQRVVHAGGTIRIGTAAQNGLEVTSAVRIDPRAVLDASGIHGIADVARGGSDLGLDTRADSPFVPVDVDGDAGSIVINAASGLIAGDLRLAPGGEAGRGGSLTIENIDTYGRGGLLVRQSWEAEPADTEAEPSPHLTVIADSIASSGLDTLNLKTTANGNNVHGVLFDGDVSLSARRSITLTADRIQRVAGPEGETASVELSAAYVVFKGSENPYYDDPGLPYADDLSGTLTVDAGLIDIAGWINFDCTAWNCPVPAYGGFGLLDFRSKGDIRLIGGVNRQSADPEGLYRTGGFSTGGAVRFDAAQVYVSMGYLESVEGSGSRSSALERDDADPGFLVRSGKKITIASNGNPTPVPLTFGARLTLRAPVIEQAGVLRSPGGQLRLEAVDRIDADGNSVAGRLVLAPGSLTSTALDGITVPFGVVDPLQEGLFIGYARADAAPTQSIELNAAAVDMQEGAVVDVSGGGDLTGWSFTAGTGGTRDILSGTTGDGYFAVVPSLGDAPAPSRPLSEIGLLTGQISPFADRRLTVGDTVWLEDVAGLAAGYYTLLPAGYAVLDGALLVRPAANSGQFAAPVAAITRDDGLRIVSGYRAVADTGIRNPFWSSFEVLDGATWRRYSAVTTYSFDTTKVTQSTAAGIVTRTLADAGTLTVKARNSLNLAGSGLFDAPKGLSGTLEIAAPKIVLANADSSVPEGNLFVDAAQLQALGAGSVLLGGTRPRTTGVPIALQDSTPIRSGLTITTVATDVHIADGTVFSGGELILLASDSVSIGKGVRLTATGVADSFDPSSLLLSGDGAMLRLSAGERVGLTRASGGGATGTLAIGSGSVLTTEGSLSLDASAGFLLAQDAALDVAQLDLATDRINLGATPVGEAGTTLGQATLERLAASADLLLRGYQSIAVFGDVALGERGADGAANLQAITLDTALLRGEGADGEGLTLTAGTLTLRNTGGSATTPTVGGGRLNLDVDTLALGPGATSLDGFAALGGQARALRTEGEGTLSVAGDVDLAVGSVIAGSGSNYAIDATGALSIAHAAAPEQTADADTLLGGKLALSGASLAFDSAAQARGGTIALVARDGDVALGEHAVLDVSGAAVDFIDVVKIAPGGVVQLTASGDVVSDAASRIDVSGATKGGNAGVVNVTAGGTARLAGRLVANVAEGHRGGEFTLDAATADFASLNTELNSGGFNASREIRLRDQDIVLARGETIEAHRVTLRADDGEVRVLGTIAAGGSEGNPDGGVVRLSGRNVVLESGARIDAAALEGDEASFAPASARVELDADEGRVTFASGAAIDVSGGRDGGGRVAVRAARTASGVDADLSGTVTGALEKHLVGSRVYGADTVDAGLVSTLLNDANTWLAGASVPAGWDKGAGIVVRSASDLTVADNIDLASVAGPGWLRLEAGGDLVIKASISSGFDSTAPEAQLGDGSSFSYGFEAAGDVLFVAPEPVASVPVTVAPGQAFDIPRSSDPLISLTIQADWDLRALGSNYFIQTEDGNLYTSNSHPWLGSVVPAGSTITLFGNDWLEPTNIPAGYVLPADVFPAGLSYPPEAQPSQPRVIRTGGDTRVRAGGNVNIEPLVAIYSAGRRTGTEEGFDRSGYGTQKTDGTRVLGEFPTQGGDIEIAAGGNIVAPVSTHSVSSWLFRYGDATWDGISTNTTVIDQTNWSIVFRNFREGVGALGGGSVRVRAGGDIRDLTVAIPTTGHLKTPFGRHPSAADLVVRGGGDLDLRTSGSLLGGFFLLGRGQAELTAAGSIGEGALTDVIIRDITQSNPLTEKRGLNPVIGLMDATARFTAGGDVAIEGAYDPTMSPQICENLVGICATPAVGTTQGGTGSAFVGYSDRTALEIVSVGGDAAYRDNGYAGTAVSRWNSELIWQIRPTLLAAFQVGTAGATQVSPGTMRIAALAGDVILSPATGITEGLEPGFKLASAPRGTLEVVAQRDIWNSYSQSYGGGRIVIGDTATEYIRNALAPQGTMGVSVLASTNQQDFFSNVGNNQYRGLTPLHAGDTEPVRLIALTGSIANPLQSIQTFATWELTSPKPVYVYAGQDVVQPLLDIQHNSDSDVSRLIAGRDYRFIGTSIAGAGLLWVEAGRDYVHRGTDGTLLSNGNLTNPALPDRGAEIIIAAGTAQGNDYGAFAALYLDPSNLADPTFGLSHPTNAGKVVHTYEEELETWLSGQGFTDVTPENRLALFNTLPETRRKTFLQQVLFSELQATGIDYNDPDGARYKQYTRGYGALHQLFPGTAELESRDNPAGGNIVINNGLIATRSGGNITLLAPYGRIDIGNPQVDVTRVTDAGVITSRGGDLNIVANGTISLASSRAFTLGGGDVLMWTSYGDITAGFGSKTSVRSAPLAYLMDADGAVTLNNFGTNTGAGIGVLDAFDGEDDNRKPSRLDLLAFFGEVNAGDAGIRVVGDLNIAALRVVNAANIEVSGEAVGIPQIPVVNVGALNAASNATSAIVNEAAQLAERSRPQVRPEVPVIVQVRLLGFGENP